MFLFLKILSSVYSFVLRFVFLCYQCGIFKTYSFKTPIISVGNLVVGGSGKTPMVIALSRLLSKKNISHVIVSRGYKKNIAGTLVVSDGSKVLISNPSECGDEPFLLATKLLSIGANE